MKTCKTCGETKPVGEFSPNGRRGWKPRCKTCRAAAKRTDETRAYQRAAYARNLGKRRAAARARRAHNRERERERYRAYDMRNRERRRERVVAERKTAKGRARKALGDAVYCGSIVKPSRCQECGKPTPRARLAGHHHRGYDRPLDVVWLCSICHGRAHWKPVEAAA